ncbi:CPBP family intramembrane glutamic endopeptidase [Halorarum halobium]|uniref:CPBP family intramembrane glutamic endopeptidase n=1 Tax=Halorarum halobium TaxID=3075121 RepID=UPI0028A6DF79|nr:CPBP family intramembrane glutamic endopeptidase [Halobaculum sp. XH14]
MPEWTTFAGLTGVVLLLLLVLARLTQEAVGGGTADVGSDRSGDAHSTGSAPDSNRNRNPKSDFFAEEWRWGPDERAVTRESRPSEEQSGPAGPRSADAQNVLDAPGSEDTSHPPGPTRPELADLPQPALLANVALSQGLFGLVLVIGAWWAEIPLSALGLDPVATPKLLGIGLGLGLLLWVANELAGRVGARFGVDGGERLRELLAPDTPGGWVLLLAGVLPLVALFEEFLFRAALVGVLGAGFGLPAWLLIAGSSVAFAVGHGAQGRAGMLVTGTLGAVLAVAFVATGSLLVVVVAHYLVNALEFLVHEGRTPGV